MLKININTISLLVVIGAYECVFNEEDDTLTITGTLDRSNVFQSIVKMSKHAEMLSTRSNDDE